jgi:secondary thiamine-phosphate synthase enzyme
MHQQIIDIHTEGRALIDITSRIRDEVRISGVKTGVVNIFIQHTSASLTIQENADPDVRRDLNAFFSRLVPDGDPLYRHVDEGPDDMSAHVRTVLTSTSLTVPVTDMNLSLGTWQAIYVWEHRQAPHRRRLVVTVQG